MMLIISSRMSNVENCTNLSPITTSWNEKFTYFPCAKMVLHQPFVTDTCHIFLWLLLSELYHLYSAISTARKKTMRKNLYICNSSLFNMNIFCFRTGIQLKDILFQNKTIFYVMLTNSDLILNFNMIARAKEYPNNSTKASRTGLQKGVSFMQFRPLVY